MLTEAFIPHSLYFMLDVRTALAWVGLGTEAQLFATVFSRAVQ